MVEVRPITEADRGVWRDLWRGYLEFYESGVPEEVYASTFTRLLSAEPYDPCGFIAWEGGEAVGLVHYMEHRHCWKEANVCYLQDLFAPPKARGQGVGRALIEAVYAEADRRGFGAVYWLTADDNAEARKLYDRIAKKTPFIKYQR
ncbi:GNAT family N-acetyltransferase [Parvularcula sp. ZS-1/3]|uniref:GNAT family N-acetyltransferase n=1 Tax=Parvularcula mediterranea TaxID=2732508 RepID=A0A7Y3W459_9PROT|nr:GNAT family N-acetyltransferase [Parvularcula mediterranea]NNU15189.1 GNAT family N-acetyltransferase [Parvularcula mediterranea]